jgi:hypothetical protein
LSYSDVVLVEAETHEELTAKVVDLIRKLGPPSNNYVYSIGGNPYEPRPKKRIARKITNDLDNLVTIINALIFEPQPRTMMAGPMTRNHVAGSASMEKKLEEREAEFKARLQQLKDQRKALKEDMKRLKKKIKELKGSTLNLPQGEGEGEGDDDEQD